MCQIKMTNVQYFTSVHFWAPLLTWSLPLAAIADMKKGPELISGKVTGALCLYSMMFMRFALRVQPRNMLMFATHVVNESAQLIQLSRFLMYQASTKS